MDDTRIYNIIDFGAKSGTSIDPITNSEAIQMTINTCSESGGGVVLVPEKSEIIAAPFNLKSNIELFLSPGSEIIASPNEAYYQESAFRDNHLEGSIWIGGKNANNISIRGTGHINGNGVAFMGPEQKTAFDLKPFKEFDRRPHIFTLIGCDNLVIKDITIKNSAYWGIHLVGCNNILINNVSIKNHLKIRNSDGIDLDHCKNARVLNCNIESGDDSICIKNRREYSEFGSCEKILVKNCKLTSTSCAFKIGSENIDEIKDISVEDCEIIKSNRGIGIQNRDEGTVKNVSFSNMKIECRLFDDVWWGKAEPIYITAFKRARINDKDAKFRFAKDQEEGSVGSIKKIFFIDCDCKSENGIFVSGETSKISDISFENVNITLNKITKYKGGKYDRRPCSIEGILKAPTCGFYIDIAEAITLKNCNVIWGRSKPEYYDCSIYSNEVDSLTIENIKEKSIE